MEEKIEISMTARILADPKRDWQEFVSVVAEKRAEVERIIPDFNFSIRA